MRRPSISFWLKSHCCHTRSYCCIVQGLNWKYIYSNCQWRVREKIHFLQMTAWSESLSRCIIVWKTCLHVLYNLNLYWLCVIETKPKFSAQGRLFTSSGHVKGYDYSGYGYEPVIKLALDCGYGYRHCCRNRHCCRKMLNMIKQILIVKPKKTSIKITIEKSHAVFIKNDTVI